MLMNALRVLIADDDRLTRVVLSKMLSKLGHQVVAEAGDGMEAQRLALQHQPDLAIFDINMPGCTGLEAARRIQGEHPIAVIIVSAHSDAGLGQEAAGSGAHGYLLKPITPAQLAPVIELALANFQQGRVQEEKLLKMTEALETRKIVERAKGILMRQTGLDEEAAYIRLQKTARNENRKLRDVAQAVILADSTRHGHDG